MLGYVLRYEICREGNGTDIICSFMSIVCVDAGALWLLMFEEVLSYGASRRRGIT